MVLPGFFAFAKTQDHSRRETRRGTTRAFWQTRPLRKGDICMFSKTIAPRSGNLFTSTYLLAILAAVVQLFTVSGLAQSTFGGFVGTVKDPSGAVIAGATITVKNVGTSSTRTANTNETGSYTVVNLEPGDYEITMDQPGFQTVTRANLQLLARQTVRVDGVMPLLSQAQTVEVNTAAVAPIATEVSNIAETKLGRELIDLPIALGSRASGSTSAFSTLTTQPGVEIDNSGQISVAGSTIDMVGITIDGISTQSARNSAPIAELFPSFDSISEIRVSEINNSAEFGQVSDITTTTKSGTNQFHGGVFENHQNSALAARNTFSPTVPKVIMNDFGAFGGGPIRKDKTFFFADYEGLRLPLQQVLVENVPSLALRKGDLSALPQQIKDVDGTPFPGNKIPMSRISPLSLGVLDKLFPLPNTGAPDAMSAWTTTSPPRSRSLGGLLIKASRIPSHRATHAPAATLPLSTEALWLGRFRDQRKIGASQEPTTGSSARRSSTSFEPGGPVSTNRRVWAFKAARLRINWGLALISSKAVSSWNEKPSFPTSASQGSSAPVASAQTASRRRPFSSWTTLRG